MSYLKWGGKKYYPQKPKPYKPDINDLMKPLGEKSNKGNVWGSVITNVFKEDILPPVETFHLTTEDNSPLLTEGGDFLDYDFV